MVQLDYDKIFRNNPDAFSQPHHFALEYAKIARPEWTILDIGCFQGNNMMPFINRKVAKVTGVDSAYRPLTALRARLEEHEDEKIFDRVSLFHKEIQEFSFKKYDLVMCFKMLQNLDLDDAKKLIHKIQSSTKVGGYNLYSFWEKGIYENGGYFTQKEFINMYSRSISHPFRSWAIERIYTTEEPLEYDIKAKCVHIALKKER